MDIRAEYSRWLERAVDDSDLIEELRGLDPDGGEVSDRFYRDLAFGTGGLRGVLGAGTNRMNIYTVRRATQGLCAWLKASGGTPSVAIAHDSRIKSGLFAREAARVLAANGVTAWIYPRLEPTPALSWAVRYFHCGAGICVTASHNPAKYNGYKVYGPDGGQITLDAAERVQREIGGVDPFDGVKVTPWVMYAAIGPNAFRGYDDNGDLEGNFSNATGVSGPWITRGLLPAWANMGILRGADKAFDSYGNGFWAGVTGDITVMDALRIAWDFTYGTVSFDSSAFNRQGWMGALLVEYAFDWGTPGLVGWYATGDDANLGNGSERLPSISTGAMDNVFSNYALDGKVYIGRDAAMYNNLAGSWAIGLRVRDVSFIENLTHIFRVYYIGGTNSAGILDEARSRDFNPTPNNFGGQAYGVENMYLTDHDSAMEFGVTSVLDVYENLKVALDVGYIALWLDKSEDVWGSSKINGRDDTTRDAWNANLMFLYSF